MIKIQAEDFDVDMILGEMKGRCDMGAVVNFVGVVRPEGNIRGIEFRDL